MKARMKRRVRSASPTRMAAARGETCDPNAGECGECLSCTYSRTGEYTCSLAADARCAEDVECVEGEVCENCDCVASGSGCDFDDDCTGDLVCGPDGTCQECITAGDCDGECCDSGECFECCFDDDCAGDLVCTEADDACVECEDDWQCADTEICDNNTCVDEGGGGGGGCDTYEDCATGQVCNDTGTCVPGADPSLVQVDNCSIRQDSVSPDETVTVDAAVTNDNSVAASVTTEWTVDGKTFATPTYTTLEANETREVTERFIPSGFDLSGDVSVSVNVVDVQGTTGGTTKTVGALGVLAAVAYFATR